MKGARHRDGGREILPFERKIDIAAVPIAEFNAVGRCRDGSMQRSAQHETRSGQAVDEVLDGSGIVGQIWPQDVVAAGNGEKLDIGALVVEMRHQQRARSRPLARGGCVQGRQEQARIAHRHAVAKAQRRAGQGPAHRQDLGVRETVLAQPGLRAQPAAPENWGALPPNRSIRARRNHRCNCRPREAPGRALAGRRRGAGENIARGNHRNSGDVRPASSI